jgi:hypothetical protein
MQEEMLAVHLTLLNYGLSRGNSFQRWRNVANTILFEDPGVIKIHRTRVIHLYKADYIYTKIFYTCLSYVLACPKNEEGRTGAYAQTDANTTDRQNQNRQTQTEQADAIRSNKTQTEVRQSDNNRIETDKRRHRRNEHRTTKITICSRRRQRIN